MKSRTRPVLTPDVEVGVVPLPSLHWSSSFSSLLAPCASLPTQLWPSHSDPAGKQPGSPCKRTALRKPLLGAQGHAAVNHGLRLLARCRHCILGKGLMISAPGDFLVPQASSPCLLASAMQRPFCLPSTALCLSPQSRTWPGKLTIGSLPGACSADWPVPATS